MSENITKKPSHFFVLGAAKCGTSALYYYLNQHPEIYMSVPKEPLFFEKEYEKGLNFYWDTYFSGWNGQQYVGDARHRNLYLPYVPERIAEHFPYAKLIMIVRNPVERAYSHYIHRKIRGFERETFDRAIELDYERIKRKGRINSDPYIADYISNMEADGAGGGSLRTYLDTGYYAEQAQRYYQYFGRDQLYIVFSEDLRARTEETFSDILRFIDSKLPTVTIDFRLINERADKLYHLLSRKLAKYRKLFAFISPLKSNYLKKGLKKTTGFLDAQFGKEDEQISYETRRWLLSHYLEHNRALEKLTGRDLSHWNS